jgi:hypothetical protein
MNSWIDLHALWKIVVVGLLAGAGLPAVFAIGLRALAAGPNNTTLASVDDDRVSGGSIAGLVGATICFAIVLAAIGLGIYQVVAAS